MWRRPARPRARRPGRNEAGFTLIELLVALTVLSVGVFGTATVFISSMRVSAVAKNRTRAVSVATREVEAMRSADYAAVGFSPLAVGFRAGVTETGADCVPPLAGCRETVIVASPASTPIGTTSTIENISYTVRRDIVWVANALTSRAYKRLISRVTWTDGGGTHSMLHDAAVYPGGLGAVVTSSTTTTAPLLLTPGQPPAFTAAPNLVTPSTSIDLAWVTGSPPATGWDIDYSSNGGSTWILLVRGQPAALTTFTASALSSSTAYQFRLRGANGTQYSPYATASATTAAAAGCSVGSASVTPAIVRKKSANTLFDDLSVTVNSSGSCTGLTVKYPATGDPAAVTMTKSGSVFTHVLDKNAHQWTVGSKVIRVFSAAGAELAQISLVVTL